MRCLPLVYGVGILFIISMGLGGLLIKANAKVDVLKAENAYKEVGIMQLTEAIEVQNAEVEKYRVDLEKAQKEWEEREPAVKIVERWKTKYVKKDSNETCTDVLEFIRTNGF